MLNQAYDPPEKNGGSKPCPLDKDEMNWFRHNKPAEVSNDTFVTLIRLAQDDPDMKLKLRDILALPAQQRKSLLKTAIVEMELQSAPAEFIAAIACLVDDELAGKALALICRETNNMAKYEN